MIFIIIFFFGQNTRDWQGRHVADRKGDASLRRAERTRIGSTHTGGKFKSGQRMVFLPVLPDAFVRVSSYLGLLSSMVCKNKGL